MNKTPKESKLTLVELKDLLAEFSTLEDNNPKKYDAWKNLICSAQNSIEAGYLHRFIDGNLRIGVGEYILEYSINES